MRVPAIAVLLALLSIALAAPKIRQQVAFDEDEDDDYDESDSEIDDEGKIYKNPRNLPSTVCPRNEEQAELSGQKCLRKCSTDEDCKSKKKKCHCDSYCGMTCIKPDRECPELQRPDHSTMIVSGKLFGDRANYTCDHGYMLVGLKERVCRADGRWSGSNPSCKSDSAFFCKEPPKVMLTRNNALPEQTTFEVDSTIQYSCNHGYTTTGFSTAKCLFMKEVASWYGPDITCEPVNCGTPNETVSNGWHVGECNTYNCRISYHCKEGFELVGKVEKICLADGSWTPKENPQCVLLTDVQCPVPESPKNGMAVFTSKSYNAVVKYECKYGYTLSGSEKTRKCGASRQWVGTMPQCKEIDCGPPGMLHNGWIENNESGTGLGASIIFRCNDRMKMVGNASAVCQSDGKWRYPLPLCLAPCVVPQIVNGNITIAGHQGDDTKESVVEHGVMLLISCIPNYEFAANNTPVLCNNGTWSIVPSCSPARCKQMPKTPKNGMVIAPKTEHGMKAVFKCKDGYKLIGGGPYNDSYHVQCSFGNWLGDIPICIEVFCPFPGLIENGKVLLVGNMGVYDYRPYVKKIVNNKQIMYDCDKGYVLNVGPPGATCIGGHWSPSELPKCTLGQHPGFRFNRRRRSAALVNGTLDDVPETYNAFIDFFTRFSKRIFHVKQNLRCNETNCTTSATIDARNNKTTALRRKMDMNDKRVINIVKVAYRKLERIDSKKPVADTKYSLHDFLNIMCNNCFVKLSSRQHASRNSTRSNHTTTIHANKRKDFIAQMKEFQRVMKLYSRFIRWSERKIHEKNSHQPKHHAKNKKYQTINDYYNGFHAFLDEYVNRKRTLNGTLLPSRFKDNSVAAATRIAEEFFNRTQQVVDKDLTKGNITNNNHVIITTNNNKTLIAFNMTNELPAIGSKLDIPKHRSKRIRDATS